MQIRQLFHGTDGDDILNILHSGQILPNASGKVFFSEHRPESVFMHGADRSRGVSFAVKLEVSIPAEAKLERSATPGVPDTLMVATAKPLPTRVLEVHARRLKEGRGEVELISGESDIRRYLKRQHS